GERYAVTRSSRRDRRIVRAHSSLEPRWHGRVAFGVHAGTDASDRRPHRFRDFLDRWNARRNEAPHNSHSTCAFVRGEREDFPGGLANRYAGGDELLQARGDPAVRAQTARRPRSGLITLLAGSEGSRAPSAF